ncbi:MAG: biopolymer transporter ExbD [Pirellulales bacterium]|nr:biopolymer transporter ExbD [Pirellulales bacterium]
MKIARRTSSTISAETDMTPMIDMCFQLIAFFAIAINFSSSEQDQSVRVPASELVKPVTDSVEEVMTVQMKKDGSILFGGKEYTLDSIEGALQRQVRVMQRLNRNPVTTTVIVRADKEAKSGQVQELTKKCQEAGFEKFAYRAKAEKS